MHSESDFEAGMEEPESARSAREKVGSAPDSGRSALGSRRSSRRSAQDSARSAMQSEESRHRHAQSWLDEIRAEHQPWLERQQPNGGFRQYNSLLQPGHREDGRPLTAPFASLPGSFLAEQSHGELEAGDYLLEYSGQNRPHTSPESQSRRRPHYVITEKTPSGETRIVVAGLDDSSSPTQRDSSSDFFLRKSARSDRSSIFSATSRLTTASEAERRRERTKEMKRLNTSLHSMMTDASKLWKANHNKAPSASLSQRSLSQKSTRSDLDERPVKVPTPELSRLSGWRSGLVSRVLLEEAVGFETSSRQRVPVYAACSADPECKFTTKPLKREASHVEIGMPKAPTSFTYNGKTPALFGMSKQAQRPYRVQDMHTVILGTSNSFPSHDYPVNTRPPKLEAIKAKIRRASGLGTSWTSAYSWEQDNMQALGTVPEPAGLHAQHAAAGSPLPGTWREVPETKADVDVVVGASEDRTAELEAELTAGPSVAEPSVLVTSTSGMERASGEDGGRGREWEAGLTRVATTATTGSMAGTMQWLRVET